MHRSAFLGQVSSPLWMSLLKRDARTTLGHAMGRIQRLPGVSCVDWAVMEAAGRAPPSTPVPWLAAAVPVVRYSWSRQQCNFWCNFCLAVAA